MSLQTRLVALAQAVGADVKTLRTDVDALAPKTTSYPKPIYVLDAGQTLTSVPADFPATGLVFRKLS